MIRIFHARNMRNSLFADAAEIEAQMKNCTSFEDSGYDFVGYVDTDGFDGAFAMTQNIDDSWTKAVPSYQLHEKYRAGTRSTSVGDVMMDDDGNAVAVANIGFTPINAFR